MTASSLPHSVARVDQNFLNLQQVDLFPIRTLTGERGWAEKMVAECVKHFGQAITTAKTRVESLDGFRYERIFAS